jgi:GNAT superfamily N-acetyltransferase
MDLVEVTGNETLLKQIYSLRIEAWCMSVDLPMDIIECHDSYDDEGRHWALVENNEVLAAARLTLHSDLKEVPELGTYRDFKSMMPAGPYGSFNRLIVKPSHRGKGLARRLDAVRIDAARAAGVAVVIGATGSVAGNRRRISQLIDAGFRVLGDGQPFEGGTAQYLNQQKPVIMICELGSTRRPDKIDSSAEILIDRESNPNALQKLFRLRAEVWKAQCDVGEIFDNIWSDRCDRHAMHWTAKCGEEIVAGARICFHSEMATTPDREIFERIDYPFQFPIACMNRLVVRPEFRGRGIAGRLDAIRVDAAQAHGCKMIIGVVSDVSGALRLGQLEKIGFQAIAPIFSIQDWPSDRVTPIVLRLPE